MSIERVVISNFKGLKQTDLQFRPGMNILVGDNETGKSTVLEAINLALSKQINRRDAAYELHPFLFNQSAVRDFITKVNAGQHVEPLAIEIEIYLIDDPKLAEHKGTNNSRRKNCPGVLFRLALDDDFADAYQEYISDKERLTTVPIEFYRIEWRNFADERLTARSKPIQPSLIDPSSISNPYLANRYVLELVRDYLTQKQRVDLALSYRQLREAFLSDSNVSEINKGLAQHKAIITNRDLSVALDMTTKSTWETSVTPHLDDVPLTLIGKGEQTSVKIKLALEASEACEVILIEEPENHLSPSNLNRLLADVSDQVGGKQLILTTHSSFVLNKLGVDSTIMFDGVRGVRIGNLSAQTRRYFMKLPGHDTLRMLLAERTILVEGPSDELIVHKAYWQKYRKRPLAAGVEVISLNSLAFKRFLDIAVLLDLNVCVVTDNDGDPDAVQKRYTEYLDHSNIVICFSDDERLTSLEPHLVAVNKLKTMNRVLGVDCHSQKRLLAYMQRNKADVALRIFESEMKINLPSYITDAI